MTTHSRSCGAIVALTCSACASAQVTGYDVIQRSLRTLQEQKVIPGLAQPNPFTTPGHPGLPPKTMPDPSLRAQGELPPGSPERQQFKVIRFPNYKQKESHVEGSGGVEFEYKGYHVFADTAEGDLKTNIFSLAGHVEIIGSDAVIRGERVIVDFERKTYRSFSAESQIDPHLIGGGILNDVYVKARESFGGEREIRSFDASVTTCNLERPHYSIDGEDVVVRPGVRAIFRKARIRLFGRTLVKLPYLSVPLDQRTYENLPVVGQSPDEGYYIKSKFAIPLKGESELRTRLDYMTKLGVGYGADYGYRAPRMEGFLRAYAVSGQANTFDFSSEHVQQLGWATLTLNNDIQKNNYLTAPESILMQNRAVLNVPQGKGNSRLGFSRTSNQSGDFNSVNQSISLSDQRNFAKTLRTSVDLNWLTNKQGTTGPNGQEREQLDVRFLAQDELPKGTASLEYQRSVPIGDTTNFFSGSDKTPLISFESDARRLVGESFSRRLPFRTALSLGEFQDLSGKDHVSRGALDFSFQKPDRSRNRLMVDYSGQFRQGVYSDDTAQYVLNFGTQMRYRLGRDTSANLRYNYLRPYGYSPLQQDRTGRTNLVTTDLSVRPLRTLIVGAQTGFDINRLQTSDVAWQQLGLRTEWIPKNYFMFRTLSTYDTFQQQWSSVRLDLGYQPGATLLTVGSRYDGIRKVWSNVNVFLNNLKIGRANLSAILTYNGYTKQFDSKQFSMVYDLHCAEAVLTVSEQNFGFRSGREIQFFIRLKAFPFDSFFGAGNRGQPLGTGTGRDF